jgi:alpha-tubulin suppressor-like RCC1 family protein
MTCVQSAASAGTLSPPDSVHTIYEWGNTVPATAPNDVPTTIQETDSVTSDAGNYSNVLVASNGTVWGWADTATGDTSPVLSQVPDVSNVVQRPVDGNGIFAAIEQPGLDEACPSSTTVVRWSIHSAAQVVKTMNCMDVVQLAEAAIHTFALTANGSVYVWGGGAYGVLGLGADVQSAKNPTLVPALTALTNGTAHGVLITTGMNAGSILVDGSAWSWGNNQYGQCGCGSTASQISSPTPVDQGSTFFKIIDMGGNLNTDGHELAIDRSGDVWSWGDNSDGQLGNETTVDSDVPVEVTGLAGIVDVRAGGEHSLALDSSGNVWAWGDNEYGEVGDGSYENVLTPEEVLSGVSMISAGSYHSLAQ